WLLVKASARSAYMTKTIGVSTIGVVPYWPERRRRSVWWLGRHWLLRRLTQILEAGIQAVGVREPSRMPCIASPSSTASRSTWTVWLPIFLLAALKLSAAGCIHALSSEE